METVTVSPKYQVVIPEKLRRGGRIHPGDKMAALMKHGILYFVPVRPLSKTKGMVPGLTTRGLRDEEDRS
ncbi:MAG: AbrB/MazE/SpoVT family DNA-binding domain-containing protein [Thermoplasmata archaeon]|jgi:AbrB family looped-hinge helix DNA binding protein